MSEAVEGEHLLIGVVQTSRFPTPRRLRHPQVGVYPLLRLAVHSAEAPQQFRRWDDDEMRLVFRERRQDEDPEVRLRVLDLLLLMRPPSCGGQFTLQQERAVCRVEVLGELDLKRHRSRVTGVRDEDVYASILGRNPHVQLREVFLDMRADEVLAGMDCK